MNTIKKVSVTLCNALLIITTQHVYAEPITGEIGMGGAYQAVGSSWQATTNDFATGVMFTPELFIVNSKTGTFATDVTSMIGSITSFQFDSALGLNDGSGGVEAVASIANFWTIDGFSFELTSINNQSTGNPVYLDLEGTGIISGNGYDATAGAWQLTGNGAGSTFSWSAGSVAVPTLIQIISPTDGAAINSNQVNVHGTYTGNGNTGVSVSGEVACTFNNNFYANNVPLTSGVNTLTAVRATQSGSTQSVEIDVTQNNATNYKLTASDNCKAAPLDVTFEIDAGSNTIEQLDIDYDADGTVDFSTTTPASTILQHSYLTEGVYPATVWVTSGGIVEQLNINIVVKNETQQDDRFQAIWSEMWAALKTGDKDTALQHLTPSAARAYSGIFDSLMPHMTETFDELSVIKSIESNTEIGDYAIIRLENGAIKTYMINYSRGSDGVWRIDSM